MRDPACSTCGSPSSEVGFLCQVREHDYSRRPVLECKRCSAVRVMEWEGIRAAQEDAEMNDEHFRTCNWCHHRRGLMPKLLLFQACMNRRLKLEGEARKAVA